MFLNNNSKHILCFGDSNTWGYIPNESLVSVYRRYPATKRWTGVLQSLLPEEFEVFEDGVNSRTISFIDPRPGKESRIAEDHLGQCFLAHDPLDYLIIYLGLNDLKGGYSFAVQAFQRFTALASSLKSQIDGRHPELVYIITSPVDTSKEYARQRYPEGTTACEKYREDMRQILKKQKISYIDCLSLDDLGKDGVHLTAEAHQKLGREVYKYLLSVRDKADI